MRLSIRIHGPGAIRTRDLLLRRQALYPAELRARLPGSREERGAKREKAVPSSRFPLRYSLGKSGRRDLNPGPPAPEAGALPGCATPRYYRIQD